MSMIVNRERFLCISKNSNLYIRITANLKALEINGINFFRDEVSSEREFVEFTRGKALFMRTVIFNRKKNK